MAGLYSKHKPNEEQLKVFYKRTKNFIKFNTDLTIEENFVRYIDKLNKTNTYCVLGGSISLLGDFFLDNNIKIICLVRHPMNSMSSFMTRRHPEILKQLGADLNSKKAVEWYANLWNTFFKEHIKLKTKIIRFEYTKNDSNVINNNVMRNALSGINNNTHKILSNKFGDYLKELVSDNYFQIYKEWDI